MKKLLRALRKNWIRVWLICAIVLFSVFAAYTAYTEVSSVKRVVSTIDSSDVLFSSNCMGRTLQNRRLDTQTYSISVCNYDQNKPLIADKAQITYDLEFYLEIKNANGSYTPITADNYSAYAEKIGNYKLCKTFDDLTGTVAEPEEKAFSSSMLTITFQDQTLKAGESASDRYKLTIDAADLRNDTEIFVHAIARKKHSENGVVQYDATLEGRLYGQRMEAETSTWTGRITDSNYKTQDYDFYNYLISGSGKGTVDLLWDPSKLSVNAYALSIYGIADPGTVSAGDAKYGASYEGWSIISFNVDSTARYRYEMQIFKNGADFNRQNLDGYIKCFFAYQAAPQE